MAKKLYIGRWSKDTYEVSSHRAGFSPSGWWGSHRLMSLCAETLHRSTPIKLKIGEVAELKLRIVKRSLTQGAGKL